MKGKKCENYIKDVGCVAHYGHSEDETCKGYKISCYMYEHKEDNEDKKQVEETSTKTERV